MPQLSRRVQLFTDSVIRRMTRISEQYDAINLSQGYPDFDPVSYTHLTLPTNREV